MTSLGILKAAPYVGLRPFAETDAHLFFGRDKHVDGVLARLRHDATQRFVAVVGASGAGKSSLVRAGVVPALHTGALPQAGHRWEIHTITPGDAPIDMLAETLAADARWRGALPVEPGGDAAGPRSDAADYLAAMMRASPSALVDLEARTADPAAPSAVLIIVDQFEEIFRFRQADRDGAEAFVKLLLHAASAPERQLYVMITMRADFLGDCSKFHGLPEAINEGLYLTPRLDRERLRSTIVAPLVLVGGRIDDVLVARLLNDLQSEDELPVLQHALLRMWLCAPEDRGRREIRLDDFTAICRPWHDGDGPASDVEPNINFALDRHASAIFKSLPDDRQVVARAVFLALTDRGATGQAVRRPQSRSELIAQIGDGCEADIDAVIEVYAVPGIGFIHRRQRRGAAAGDLAFDISHESLIRHWQRLQRWMAEEAQDVDDLRAYCDRARRHSSGGADLLNANELEQAEAWRQRLQARRRFDGWARRYIPSAPEPLRACGVLIESSRRRLDESKAIEERRAIEEREAERRIMHAEQEAEHNRFRLEREAERQRLEAERERSLAKAAKARSIEAERHAQERNEFAERQRVLAIEADRNARRARTRTRWAVAAAAFATLATATALQFGVLADEQREAAIAQAELARSRQLETDAASIWGNISQSAGELGRHELSALWGIMTASSQMRDKLWIQLRGSESNLLRLA
ncbi:MAG: hypothetical protein FJX57_06835, partial [Alphaproteobacteria bacterium]|nr:hypothetical protein [Alphaproteobacteria bacterium]